MSTADQQGPKAVDGTIVMIAILCHEANKTYCEMHGDNSQAKWEDAPQWQKESAIAGVEMHFNNPSATPEDSHESWYKQKVEDGWKYGTVKDPEKKEHPCMVAYDELPLEQQMKDSIFGGIAKSMLKKAIKVGKLSRPMTRGEEVMNVQFNPGGLKSVNTIKEKFAELHDLLALELQYAQMSIMNREEKKARTARQVGMTPEQIADDNAQSSKAMAPYPKQAGDSGRLMAVAFTNIEQAQMWAVKSVTR